MMNKAVLEIDLDETTILSLIITYLLESDLYLNFKLDYNLEGKLFYNYKIIKFKFHLLIFIIY